MNLEEKIRKVCEAFIDNSNLHVDRLRENQENCGKCAYINCNEDFPRDCPVLLAREILES